MHLFYLFIFSSFLLSCGSRCIIGTGEPEQRSEKVSSFHSVVLEGPFDVELVYAKGNKGGSAKVSALMQENLREHVRFEIADSILTIRSERCFQSAEPILFTLLSSEFRSVENSGSGRVYSTSAIGGDSIFVRNSGSGNIELELRLERSHVENDGSGNVVVSGFTRQTEMELNGSGRIEAKAIRNDKAIVNNNGSGTILINCGGSVDVYVRGSGNIEVFGNPASYRQSIEGSGTVLRNALITR